MLDEAIVLLGGMGTRLLPYTKTVPKEMLPIFDEPAIFKIVKEAYNSGIKKIIFVVTEHNKDLIKKFFSRDEYLDTFLMDKPDKKKMLNEVNTILNNMEFVYVEQKIKGTYGALYSAKDYIKNDDFIVMYGDDLIDNSIPITKLLIEEYMITHKMQVACLKKDYEELNDVGIVKIDNHNNLIDLVKKEEANTTLELHGRMLLNKKIFTIKDKLFKHDNDEYYLPYALLHFKGEVNVFEYSGKYFNLGSKIGFILASIHYAMKDDKYKNDLIKEIKEIL